MDWVTIMQSIDFAKVMQLDTELSNFTNCIKFDSLAILGLALIQLQFFCI